MIYYGPGSVKAVRGRLRPAFQAVETFFHSRHAIAKLHDLAHHELEASLNAVEARFNAGEASVGIVGEEGDQRAIEEHRNDDGNKQLEIRHARSSL